MTERTRDEPVLPMDRLAFRLKEVAPLLGVSERKLREVQHILPRVRLGGVVLFPRQALERWLEDHAVVESDQIGTVAEAALRGLSDLNDE